MVRQGAEQMGGGREAVAVHLCSGAPLAHLSAAEEEEADTKRHAWAGSVAEAYLSGIFCVPLVARLLA